VSTHEFYTIGGYFDDWYATHMVALRACQDALASGVAGILLACLGQPALIASRVGTDAAAVVQLERAERLLSQCHDEHGQAIALRTLANALRRQGQLSRPLTLFQRALGYYASSGDTVGRWQTLRFIGQTHLDRGEAGCALAGLLEAQQVADELGRPRLIAQTRYWTGQARLALDDLPGAVADFAAVRAAFPEPTSVGHAYWAHGSGEAAARAGRFDEAVGTLELAERLAGEGGDAVLLGRVVLSLAAVAAARGAVDEQIAALTRAVDTFAECGAYYLQARALGASATALDGRDPARAALAWTRLEDLYDELNVPDEDRVYRRPT
jgi:tetratricopeptide (TPR) repeat protein